MGMILNLDFLKSFKLPLAKSKHAHTSAVCFYSPSSSLFYEYSDKTLKPVLKPSNKAKLISFLAIDDILTEAVDINKFLVGQELFDAIELKLFDELALEPSIEYKICYVEHPEEIQNQETKKYNAFIATYPAIKQRLGLLEDEYIDFVFAPQTVIRTLFTKNFLSDSVTFAFIYLYNDSAYLCVYQNGHYVYSKSIRGSIRALTERFSEILGERVDADDLIKILTTIEFRTKRVEFEAAFKTLIEEFFASISDILMHAKRINQISGYEAIFVGTEHGNIARLSEIAAEYFETPFRDFDFNLGIKTDGFVDMGTKLMFFAYLHDIENYENLNFSIFLRPPPLLQRDAGKFLLISTAALIVSFSYPLYNMTAAGAYYSLKISSLEKELASLKIEQNKIEMLRARAQKEQNELIKRNDEEAKKQSDTVAMLKELETKRKQNSSVSAKTAQISNIAANSSVALRSIDINETHIKIECSSDKAALISKFAKKLLLATGKKISADDIAKDANSTRFIGNISMEDGE
jgi:hypothetical protein